MHSINEQVVRHSFVKRVELVYGPQMTHALGYASPDAVRLMISDIVDAFPESISVDWKEA